MDTVEVKKNNKGKVYFIGIAATVVLTILSLSTAYTDWLYIINGDMVFAAFLDLLRTFMFIAAGILTVIKNNQKQTLKRLGYLLILAGIGDYYFSYYVITAGTVIAIGFIIDFFKPIPALGSQD